MFLYLWPASIPTNMSCTPYTSWCIALVLEENTPRGSAVLESYFGSLPFTACLDIWWLSYTYIIVHIYICVCVCVCMHYVVSAAMPTLSIFGLATFIFVGWHCVYSVSFAEGWSIQLMANWITPPKAHDMVLETATHATSIRYTCQKCAG